MSPESIALHERKLGRARRNKQRAEDRRTHLRALRPTPANDQHIEDETELVVLLSVEIQELRECLARWSMAI